MTNGPTNDLNSQVTVSGYACDSVALLLDLSLAHDEDDGARGPQEQVIQDV